MVDIVDIMHEQSVEVFAAKKEMLAEGEDAAIHQVGKGKDILSISVSSMVLQSANSPITKGIKVKANMSSGEEDRLPEEELLGQLK